MSLFGVRFVAQALLGGLACMPAWADVFVSDYSGGKVQRFTLAGAPLGVFVWSGLSKPSNLRFGTDGNLYVADANGIQVFDGSTGAFVKTFASSATQLFDFTFDGAGNVYAVDGIKVLKFNASGAPVATYTNLVSTPEGIALGAGGHLLVSNTYGGDYRNTITDLDPVTGNATVFAVGLSEPVGISRGPDGRYYAGNFTFAKAYGGTRPDTIDVIPAGGGSSVLWNSGGSLNGTTYLTFGAGTLYVASYYNQTVQMFDAATGVSSGQFAAFGSASGIAVQVPEPATGLLLGGGLLVLLSGLGAKGKT